MRAVAGGRGRTGLVAAVVAGSLAWGAAASAASPVQAGARAGTQAGIATVSAVARPTATVVAARTVTEGDTGSRAMAFTVRLSRPAPGTVSVRYTTVNGTATAGSDYTRAAGRLVFRRGQRARVVRVVVRGDTAIEADETLQLRLSTPVGVRIARRQARGTIRNDDSDVSLAGNSVPENQPAGTTVGVLSTPGGVAPVTYGLVAGEGDTDNASFTLDGATLKTAAAFNFEVKAAYTVRVRSTAAGGVVRERAFAVAVTNVGEPVLLSPGSVAENQPAGTAVGTLSTGGGGAGPFTYSLVAGTGDADNGSFTLDGTSLTTAATFDHEAKAQYALRVRSVDPAGVVKETPLVVAVSNVNEPPVATDNSYSGAVGNTLAVVGAVGSGPKVTLAGAVPIDDDSDPDAGTTLAAVAETVPTALGGSATINADGTFLYTPPVAVRSATDTFAYRVTDGEFGPQAQVSVTIGNDLVWYVDASKPGSGDGRSTSPFNSLVAINDPAGSGDTDGTGDHLFIHGPGTYAGSALQLEAGQRVRTTASGLTIGAAAIVPAGGTAPLIQNLIAGNGLVLAEGVDVDGITISGIAGNGIVSTGVNNATVGSGVAVGNFGTTGIAVSGGTTGTLSLAASVSGGNRSVSVNGRSGGTVVFSGQLTGGPNGIALTSNTGATINFTGTIAMNATASAAFSATGGGTVNVTGSNHTLTATGQPAVAINGVTIGASGVTFARINANGGPAGIDLGNTGTGAFTLSGAQPSTITNMTDNGVSLLSTGPVSLNALTVSNSLNGGISANTVAGLIITGSTITNNGDSITEGGVEFGGMSGTSAITNTTVTQSAGDNVSFQQTSGAATLNISGSTIAQHKPGGGQGLYVSGSGGSLTVNVSGSTFTDNRGSHIRAAASGSVSVTLTASGNTFTTTAGGAPNVVHGNIYLSTGDSGNLTATIQNTTTFTGAKTDAIRMESFVGSTLRATITGVTIGNAGTTGSGSSTGRIISADRQGSSVLRTSITNNALRQWGGDSALWMQSGNGSGGSLNATVTGNTISNPASNGINFHGVWFRSGVLAGDNQTNCLKLGDLLNVNAGLKNTLNGIGRNGGVDIRLQQSQSTTLRLPGYTGGATSNADAQNYVIAANSFAPTANATNSGAPGFAGGGDCTPP